MTAPFATLTSAGLSIDQATLASSGVHSLRIAFSQSDPSTLTAGLQIVPDASAANPNFVIGHRVSWKVDSFTSFGDFVTALTADLNGTNAAIAVLAVGPYDATGGILSVDQMIVILND